MFRQKRGLSDVITVALIILLAISAVVIVWTFVRQTLESTGKEISSTCVRVDVRPISCSTSSPNVVVENGPGDITVDSVKLVFYDSTSSNSVIIDSATGCGNIGPLQRKTCTLTGIPAVGGATAAKVAAAAVVGAKTCPIGGVTVACS